MPRPLQKQTRNGKPYSRPSVIEQAIDVALQQDEATLMARAARLYENFQIQNYHTPAFNLVISNVPGPKVELYFAGLKVLNNYPISIPFHGAAFNITLMSYCGKLDYGLIADRDTMPDIKHFGELMQAALATLVQRAGAV